MVFIYILKLESNKYYIGKTTIPNFRLNQHFNSNGCAWTKKYKPIKIIDIIKDCDNFDEDKYTKKYMLKYGIDNVRGGTFCQIKLDNYTIKKIQKELDSATDKCYNCGKYGHFSNKCNNNNYEYYDDEDDDEDYYDDDENSNDDEEIIYTSNICYEYCEKEFNKKEVQLYENIYYKKSYKDNYSNKNNCYRCGRMGHFIDNCYASKHIKGYCLY